MRKIKFKGKKVDNGEWVYGYYKSWKHFNGKGYEDSHAIYEHDMGYVLVDGNSIGEFIGLADKKGTDIYEGDIMDYGNGRTLYVSFKPSFGFVATFENDQFNSMIPLHTLEVIGNIHEPKP